MVKTKHKIFHYIVQIFLACTLCSALFASCATMDSVIYVPTKAERYPQMYAEAPRSILIMPPINASTSVEAKDFFYSTMSIPLAEAGYYVFPQFLTLEYLQSQSAYDSEMFAEGDLTKFNQIMGADAVLFTQICYWNKANFLNVGSVDVAVRYTLRSAITNETLFFREAVFSYDTSADLNAEGSEFLIMLVESIMTAVSTACTDYMDVAIKGNKRALADLPAGPYSIEYMHDGEEVALSESMSIEIGSN